jgi:biotin carboxyl carrier protein
MPTYEIIIDSKPRKIELTKTGEKSFTAKIDDKQCRLELSTNNPNMEQASTIELDGKKYKIQMSKIEQSKPCQIKVEEATFKAEVVTAVRKQTSTTFEPAIITTARKSSANKLAVEGAVTAPMTGRIISVQIKKGEQVKANQVLCIIEAMKMENEITAPKAGTVQEVYVSEGFPVSEGEVLLVIA